MRQSFRHLTFSLRAEQTNDLIDARLGVRVQGLQVNLGGFRRFVSAVDGGEVFQLSPPRFRVQPFDIAALALFKRSIDEDLEKLAGSKKTAGELALGAVG